MLTKQLFTISTVLLTAFIPVSALALKTHNGQTIFEASPTILDVSTTSTKARLSIVKYHLIVKIPANAGEPLQAIKIEQRKNFPDSIIFDQNQTRAFLGDSHQQELTLSPTAMKEKEMSPGEITVIFAQPIPPGNLVTIELKPKNNPRFSGIYQFGVTAYPQGENPQGLYLGSRRINIRK